MDAGLPAVADHLAGAGQAAEGAGLLAGVVRFDLEGQRLGVPVMAVLA